MPQDQERKKAIETLTRMIQQNEVGMFTTLMPDGTLRSRPMVAVAHEFDGDLWFFTESDATKVEEVENHAQVNISFASPEENRYVSVSGMAQRIHDERKAEILWKPEYAAWFDEEANPSDLDFLKVTIDRAEFWDASESRMVQMMGFAKSLFGRDQSRPAQHGKIHWPENETASQQTQASQHE